MNDPYCFFNDDKFSIKRSIQQSKTFSVFENNIFIGTSRYYQSKILPHGYWMAYLQLKNLDIRDITNDDLPQITNILKRNYINYEFIIEEYDDGNVLGWNYYDQFKKKIDIPMKNNEFIIYDIKKIYKILSIIKFNRLIKLRNSQ